MGFFREIVDVYKGMKLLAEGSLHYTGRDPEIEYLLEKYRLLERHESLVPTSRFDSASGSIETTEVRYNTLTEKARKILTIERGFKRFAKEVFC